jgi:hypothetical protein
MGMSKTQKKMAWILGIVATVGLLCNVFFYIFPQLDPDQSNRLQNIIFCMIGVAMAAPSLFKQTKITKAMLVGNIFIGALFAFTEPGSQIFGTVIMAMAIIAGYSYGFYDDHKQTRITITAIVVYSSIAMFVPGDFSTKVPVATTYTVFIAAFIYALYTILEERISKEKAVENRMISVIEKYENLIDGAITIIKHNEENQNGCE